MFGGGLRQSNTAVVVHRVDADHARAIGTHALPDSVERHAVGRLPRSYGGRYRCRSGSPGVLPSRRNSTTPTAIVHNGISANEQKPVRKLTMLSTSSSDRLTVGSTMGWRAAVTTRTHPRTAPVHASHPGTSAARRRA